MSLAVGASGLGPRLLRKGCSIGDGRDSQVRHVWLTSKDSQELGVNVECLGDLQGPKFRVGEPLDSTRLRAHLRSREAFQIPDIRLFCFLAVGWRSEMLDRDSNRPLKQEA